MSTPSVNRPRTDVVIIYIGGDTPHVWTDAELIEQEHLSTYGLPCFVRSNPPGPGVAPDLHDCLRWLYNHNVPRGSSVLLDLETAIARSYVLPFGYGLNQAGYKCLVYGSRSTLYRNPKMDGYFDAHPGDPAQVDPGNVGTQYDYTGSFDLSDLLDTVSLWRFQPAIANQAVTTPAPVAPPTAVVSVPSVKKGRLLYLCYTPQPNSHQYQVFDNGVVVEVPEESDGSALAKIEGVSYVGPVSPAYITNLQNLGKGAA